MPLPLPSVPSLPSLSAKINPCGTRDPSFARLKILSAVTEAFKVAKKIFDRNGNGSPLSSDTLTNVNLTPVVIDVYIHVIRDNTEGNVSDSDLTKQIEVLNNAYASQGQKDCDGKFRSGGAATNISFNLKAVTRTKNKGWFTCTTMSDNVRSNEQVMKKTLRRGDCSTLNIYSVKLDNLLGWANFPDDCQKFSKLDGVVIDYRTMPNGSRDKFDEGDTLVHEVGHWLGLFHTFQGGCRGTGDQVADTPAERSANSGCESALFTRDTCPFQDGNDPIHNFMDYSDDCCMYEFSANQVIRMHSMVDKYRQSSGSKTAAGVSRNKSNNRTRTSNTNTKGPCISWVCENPLINWDIKCSWKKSCTGCPEC